jgi:hypothetical protein
MSSKLPSITLFTWNILHQTYGLNLDEMPMRSPTYDETTRQDAIVLTLRHFIEGRYGDDLLAIALQEVSGAMCTRINALCGELGGVVASMVTDNATLKTPRDGAPAEDVQIEMILIFGLSKDDASRCTTESVTVTADGSVGGSPIFNFVTLTLPPPYDLVLVPVHLAFGARRQAQLEGLLQHLHELSDERARAGRYVSALVAGDCNCTSVTLAEALERCEYAAPCMNVSRGSAPTRIGKTAPAPNALCAAECIDHAVFIGHGNARWRSEAAVVRVHETDTTTLSDHRPVEFIFEA